MQLAEQEYLADIFVRRGVLPADRLEELMGTVRERNQALTDLMVAADVATQEQIAQAIAEEWGVGFMRQIDIDAVPLEVAEKIPITYAKQHKLKVCTSSFTNMRFSKPILASLR